MGQARPKISDPIKRAVRQRCGFGCVVCGIPIYEIDHLVPYAEVQEHDPENLVLLCNAHHAMKTKGLLPDQVIAEAIADPWNLRAGVSTAQTIYYVGQGCEALIGSNRYVWPVLDAGGFTVPMLIDDTPIVLFRAEDDHLLLTVQLFDEQNDLLVQIVDNELVFSVEPWDVEFEGATLTVRHALGNIFVRMKFEPAKSRITVDRGRIWRNGIEMRISESEVFLPAYVHVSKTQAVNCVVGVGVGDVPAGLSGAIFVASESVERTGFDSERPSEADVLKLPRDEALEAAQRRVKAGQELMAAMQGIENQFGRFGRLLTRAQREVAMGRPDAGTEQERVRAMWGEMVVAAPEAARLIRDRGEDFQGILECARPFDEVVAGAPGSFTELRSIIDACYQAMADVGGLIWDAQ